MLVVNLTTRKSIIELILLINSKYYISRRVTNFNSVEYFPPKAPTTTRTI